jgi:hypothetical protein
MNSTAVGPPLGYDTTIYIMERFDLSHCIEENEPQSKWTQNDWLQILAAGAGSHGVALIRQLRPRFAEHKNVPQNNWLRILAALRQYRKCASK